MYADFFIDCRLNWQASPRPWTPLHQNHFPVTRVGRVMADEDGTRAAVMDDGLCERRRRGLRQERPFESFPFSFFTLYGELYPETCAQHTAEGGGSPLLRSEARPMTSFFCPSLAIYPLGMNGFQRE